VRRAYKILYKSGMKLDEARAGIEAESAAAPELALLASFLAAPGRGIVR
jgi:UDP-N-acetylglucosamine acyltransferase